MDISTIYPSGALYISATVDGYLCRRTYLDFTTSEAIQSFCQEFGLDSDEELLPCDTCGEMITAATYGEELGFCQPCSDAYFSHEDDQEAATL